MNRIDFEASLNEQQLAAVRAPDGPVLILAAAGTGKTRTLVYRVAHLVAGGVSAERILLLTFTNRAASEMLARADELTQGALSGMWSGTFHHMANRILRRHADRIGIDNNYTILDRDDSRKLVSDCMRERKLDKKNFPKVSVILGLFGMAASTGRSLEAMAEERFDEFPVDTGELLGVHRAYEKRKRAITAMDFDDLLTNCLTLFREEPGILSHYQGKFRYVLVDEYQDTNTIQSELVDAIVREHRNLMVVGDDFQSIYAWRGADYRNIMSFPQRYTDAATYLLEINYRSVPEILAVANACIACNPQQFQKTLRATRDEHSAPRVVYVRDGEAQARMVCEQIHAWRREGIKYSDIAVLYRAHFHALELERHLPRADVPYVVTSGVRFFEQAHVKDVCSVLRLLANPEDEVAFARLLEMLPGVGPRTAARIWKKLGNRFDASEAQQRQQIGEMLRAGVAPLWQAIAPVLAAYSEEGLANDGGEIIHRFVEAFYGEHAAKTFETVDRRMDDISEIITDTTRFETVREYLSDIALLTNLDSETPGGEDSSQCVRLSTIHQAKGLEWPAVIVIWMTDGMFPSSRSLNETELGEEEERRLFYVAVTRAGEELTLCVPEIRRKPDGGLIPYQPSRFIQEIPDGLLSPSRPAFV